MKKLIPIFLLTIICSVTIYPQKIQSIYTDLTKKNCKNIKDEFLYRAECKGITGYKLEVLDGDSRMTLNVIAPDGKKSELDFGTNVSSAFSSLGAKAEWRVIKDGKRLKPIALIVRYEISEPDHPTNPGNKSFLVVIKINPDAVCITNVIKPSKNQNLTARKLADAAGNKPCLAKEM